MMALIKMISPAGITWWELNGIILTAPQPSKDNK